MTITSYKELKVYQKSYQVALETYRLTKDFPGDEKSGLAAQLQRAAVSVPAGIADGFGRHSPKEFIHILRISQGSLNVVRLYYDLAKDLSYINREDYERICRELDAVSKMLIKLIISLNEAKPKTSLQ